MTTVAILTTSLQGRLSRNLNHPRIVPQEDVVMDPKQVIQGQQHQEHHVHRHEFHHRDNNIEEGIMIIIIIPEPQVLHETRIETAIPDLILVPQHILKLEMLVQRLEVHQHPLLREDRDHKHINIVLTAVLTVRCHPSVVLTAKEAMMTGTRRRHHQQDIEDKILLHKIIPEVLLKVQRQDERSIPLV